MPITPAMRSRHAVRSYRDDPLPADLVASLTARITELNARHGVDIRLVTNDSSAYGRIWGIFVAHGVRNCLVMSGPESPDLDERLGYCGSELMLWLQDSGLNTWWAGGSFSRRGAAAASGATGRIIGVVAVGYGTTQGKPHKTKQPTDVSTYDGPAPQWFRQGVEAALQAPTAYGHQRFTIRGSGRSVSITCDNGTYSGADLGLVKHHFEVGAGPESFSWA